MFLTQFNEAKSIPSSKENEIYGYDSIKNLMISNLPNLQARLNPLRR